MCKHLFFVFRRVLHLSETNPILFQKALLQSELCEILEASTSESEAAVLASPTVRDRFLKLTGRASCDDEAGKEEAYPASTVSHAAASGRRPIEAGDECPICFEGLCDAKEGELVWCERQPASDHGCGKALHADCASRWAAAAGERATCPFCRAPWKGSNSSNGSGGGGDGSEAYINLGELQGLPLERGYYEPAYSFSYNGSRRVRRRF